MTFFFFNDTATTEIYTLSLHDALPISSKAAIDVHATAVSHVVALGEPPAAVRQPKRTNRPESPRSEEHTSELQSLAYLVCRLLLEKKKKSGPLLGVSP